MYDNMGVDINVGDPVIEKFMRVCEITIERNLLIKVG